MPMVACSRATGGGAAFQHSKGGGAALSWGGPHTRAWYCAANLSYTKRVMMLVLPTLWAQGAGSERCPCVF